jgi:hypothetical protein
MIMLKRCIVTKVVLGVIAGFGRAGPLETR